MKKYHLEGNVTSHPNPETLYGKFILTSEPIYDYRPGYVSTWTMLGDTKEDLENRASKKNLPILSVVEITNEEPAQPFLKEEQIDIATNVPPNTNWLDFAHSFLTTLLPERVITKGQAFIWENNPFPFTFLELINSGDLFAYMEYSLETSNWRIPAHVSTKGERLKIGIMTPVIGRYTQIRHVVLDTLDAQGSISKRVEIDSKSTHSYININSQALKIAGSNQS